MSIRIAKCLICKKVQPRPYHGACVCTVDGKTIQEHDAARYCPLGKFAMMPEEELTAQGYDLETSPQSPKVGGCCDPPKSH